MLFQDRHEAGRALARRLSKYAGRDDVTVLALPRGGVPVAHEVAAELGAPLDVFLVRKLGVPGSEEVAMGAIASGGIRILDEPLIRQLRIPPASVERVTQAEQVELRRREKAYRSERAPLDLAGRIVIVVDDGVATGASMRAALSAVRRLHPRSVVAAVPVAPVPTALALAQEADDFVCLATPEPFFAVGRFYRNFDPTTDAEVRFLLKSASSDEKVGVIQ